MSSFDIIFEGHPNNPFFNYDLRKGGCIGAAFLMEFKDMISVENHIFPVGFSWKVGNLNLGEKKRKKNGWEFEEYDRGE